MGCHSSILKESKELILDEEGPTVISSLNASTSSSMMTEKQRFKPSIYSYTKFLKIKSVAELRLSKFPQKNDFFEILEMWKLEIYDQLEDIVLVPAELGIILAESSKPTVILNIQAQGIRKFSFLYKFVEKIKDYLKNYKQCIEFIHKNLEFVKELAPLTVNFYLALGEEVDFGIGVNKPIDRKNLSRFLMNCNDRKTITEWNYLGSMPIPISMQFSCVYNRKSCSFYIFDGGKIENFERAFAIFDYVGAPVQKDVKDCFFTSKSEEAYCKVTIEPDGIIEASVEFSQLSFDAFNEAAAILGVDFKCNVSTYSEKVSLQLDKNGLSLVKYTNI